MDNKKEKKPIAPNDCSLGSWLLIILIGAVVGLLLFSPLDPLLKNKTDTFMGVTYSDLANMVGLAPFFIATVIAIKILAKTSFKDFVLGVGKKFDWKSTLLVLGLYVGGFAVYHLIMYQNISLRNVDPANFAFLLLYALLVVWMQTTYEELVFRGIVLRWVCKNNIDYSKRSILAALVSSFVFMLAHLANPEVLSQSGIDIVIMACSYFFSGLFMFWADIHFKSLMPGIVIHWVNNFMLMSIISQEVSAVTAPTLLIDKTPKIAALDLASIFLAYLPVIILMVCGLIKRKMAASAEKQ
jgi:membrane protease YdiL (CAAX protease family)